MRYTPMMLFAAEILRIPFNDPAFWKLPLRGFIRAMDYHADRIEAQLEAANDRKEAAKAKSRGRRYH